MSTGRKTPAIGAVFMRVFEFFGIVTLVAASQLWMLGLVPAESPTIILFLLACGPVFLALAVIALSYRRQMSLQLVQLTQAAELAAKGNHEAIEKTPVSTTSAKEIRELGDAISNIASGMRRSMREALELAYVDRTTQLPNREYFRNGLTQAISRANRNQNSGALLFVDLDGFKQVNDTYGHDTGDIVLTQVSKRLKNILRAEDIVGSNPALELDEHSSVDLEVEGSAESNRMLARLGGDEFTVLLSEIGDVADAATVSKRIIKAISRPFEIGGKRIMVGASIGIATFPHDGTDYQTILKNADMAMYQAKNEGKNTFRFFSQSLNDEAAKRSEIEKGLHRALLAGNEFEVFYQPKMDIHTRQAIGVEALLRWNHPDGSLRLPESFLDVAERCGIMPELGSWVIEQACLHIKKLDDEGLKLPVSVNVSIAQFERTDFSEVVMSALKKAGAAADRLEIELAEKVVMHNPEMISHHCRILRKLGVRFAIDDFGVGSSNLLQLSKLPFDRFKVDRTVVHLLDEIPPDEGLSIFRTIMAVAAGLGYETVAVGVETEDQLKAVKKSGCLVAQGNYFAGPMQQDELLEMLASQGKPMKRVSNVSVLKDAAQKRAKRRKMA